MDALPIDPLVPEILASLAEPRAGGSLVLEAPPGAGKTTRVPWALTGATWCKGQVLVTEPRRVAARLAATRVADERRVKLGEEVGYRVRFDERATAATRLVYLTEGLLFRRLLGDPLLEGVDAVVLDEVHEQSAELELVLGLLTLLARKRPALRLVAMSATLDAARFSDFWGGAPRLTSAGRSYEVELEHAAAGDDRPLEIRVRSAVRQSLTREGDVLVFLPGAREIRRTEEALGALDGVEVVTLHGDLPLEAQAAVVRGGPSASGRKRVVLSTNVAESSLTIPRVTTVIDSGLARVGRHDPWSGIARLEVEEISRARCVQRAGRAGRTAPGRAIQLFSQQNFQARPEQDTPELARADLSHALLSLRAAGLHEREVPLLSSPPPAQWEAAEAQLTELGALEGGQVTELGRRLLTFPLPVRLARVLVEGERLGIGARTALAVSLLAERDIVRGARTWGGGCQPGGSFQHFEAGDSDLEDRISRYEEAERKGFKGAILKDLDLDKGAVDAVARSVRQLESLLRSGRTPRGNRASSGALGGTSSTGAPSQTSRAGAATASGKTPLDPEAALTRSLLTGFWDRVAERRGQHELVLASGSTARLAETSVVTRAPLLLALSADAPQGGRRSALVRWAARVDAELLFDAQGARVEARETLGWSAEKKRVEEESALVYGRLTLEREVRAARPSPEAAAILLKAALAQGAVTFDPEARLETLSVRLGLVAAHLPEALGSIPEDFLELVKDENAREKLTLRALEAATLTCVSLEELGRLDLAEQLLAELPPSLRSLVEEATPLRLTLPGGLSVPVHYEVGRPPWIEARLQNFFSVLTTPTLCRGRLPAQVHLLAPNHRAVQVTTDLAGFWERHYPGLRKELMRKYPKHLWPEDGRTAAPPTPGRIR